MCTKPLPIRVPLVERAFQLARSGQFASVPAIASQLQGEGYFDVEEHISGSPLLRRQLKRAFPADKVALPAIAPEEHRRAAVEPA